MTTTLSPSDQVCDVCKVAQRCLLVVIDARTTTAVCRGHVLPNRPDFANGEPMFDGALSDFVVVIFDDRERPPEEWILHFLLPPPEPKQP